MEKDYIVYLVNEMAGKAAKASSIVTEILKDGKAQEKDIETAEDVLDICFDEDSDVRKNINEFSDDAKALYLTFSALMVFKVPNIEIINTISEIKSAVLREAMLSLLSSCFLLTALAEMLQKTLNKESQHENH